MGFFDSLNSFATGLQSGLETVGGISQQFANISANISAAGSGSTNVVQSGGLPSFQFPQLSQFVAGAQSLAGSVEATNLGSIDVGGSGNTSILGGSSQLIPIAIAAGLVFLLVQK